MERRDPDARDGITMRGARITGVAAETPSRKETIGMLHESIAGHLRHHGRRRDCRAPRVSLHHRLMVEFTGGQREAVDQQGRVRASKGLKTVGEGREIRLVYSAPVYLLHGPHRNGGGGGGSQYRRVETLAFRRRSLLGIVETGEGQPVGARDAIEVEQDSRGYQRTRKTASASLVGATNVTSAEPPVESEERAGRRGRALARRTRSGPAASRSRRPAR